MKPLISVIVPVYNVQSYLENCVKSILNQTYTNLEIILIDDGSTDDSGKLCDILKEKDDRIIVLHKGNEGLGYARNSGLDLQKGEYILFVDSDDYICESMIERLYERIEKYNVDTSYCGFASFTEEGKFENNESYYKDVIFNGEEVSDQVLLCMLASEPRERREIKIPMSVWHALYSSQIIRKYHIRFPSEREYISEDIIFDIKYLNHSHSISYIGDNLYYYRHANKTSLTNKFDEAELERQIKLYKKINEDLLAYMNENAFSLHTKRFFLGRVRTCIDKGVSFKEKNPKFDIISYVNRIVNNPTVVEVINSYPYNENPLRLRLFNTMVAKKRTLLIILLIKLKRLKGNNRF